MAKGQQGNEKETGVRNHESIAEPATFRQQDPAQPAENLPVPQAGGALTEAPQVDDAMFAEDAGAGMEGATQESFAIPFLIVLQKGSPQVDEASGVAIPGARQGMLYNTVTGAMRDPKVAPVQIIPCAYKRTFIRWAPRGTQGGSFKGELTDQQVAEMRQKGEIVEMDRKLYIPLPDGSVDPKKCDRINDTRNHFVIVIDEDGQGYQQAMISLASTQIKKSRNLMSALHSVKKMHPTNKMLFQPPTFANIVNVGSQPESNDQGSWMGITFALSGEVRRRDLYEAAKAFADSVKSGAVETNYSNLAEEDTAGGEAGQPSHSEPRKF
jgi:hypothetical protein